MKKILKFLKKGITITLLCLTIFTRVTAPWSTSSDTVSTYVCEPDDPDEDVEPFDSTHYA